MHKGSRGLIHRLSHDDYCLAQPDQILVCIPAFNEVKSIGDVIKKARKYAGEVLVYDDGSTDNTAEVSRAVGSTVIRNSAHKGYGAAITALFEAAKKRAGVKVIVTLDADDQHDPNEIPIVVQCILNEGYDIVIGSRFLTEKEKQKTPRHRSIGIKIITKFTSAASYNSITDAQSGFRAYSKNALSKLNLFENGMAVSAEILLKAKEKNLVLREVPISIKYDVEDASTQNPLSHGLGVLFAVMHYSSFLRPMTFFGLPGIAVLIGSAASLLMSTAWRLPSMILASLAIEVLGAALLVTWVIISSYTRWKAIHSGPCWSVTSGKAEQCEKIPPNSFSGTGMTASTKYYYKVAAVNNSGSIGEASAQASGTTPLDTIPPTVTITKSR